MLGYLKAVQEDLADDGVFIVVESAKEKFPMETDKEALV